MSLVPPAEPRHDGGRQETIRHALDSNARALRYCLMSLIDPVAVAVIAEAIRHITRRLAAQRVTRPAPSGRAG